MIGENADGERILVLMIVLHKMQLCVVLSCCLEPGLALDASGTAASLSTAAQQSECPIQTYDNLCTLPDITAPSVSRLHRFGTMPDAPPLSAEAVGVCHDARESIPTPEPCSLGRFFVCGR